MKNVKQTPIGWIYYITLLYISVLCQRLVSEEGACKLVLRYMIPCSQGFVKLGGFAG